MSEINEHSVPEQSAYVCGGGVSLADYPPPPATSGQILLNLLRSPNIAGRLWLQQQFERGATSTAAVTPGVAAGLLRAEGGATGFVLCTVGNGPRYSLMPYRGGKEAVAEAALIVSCLGARPAASTCFLSGWSAQEAAASPLTEFVSGVVEACAVLGSPLVAGNAFFHDNVLSEAALSTPVITVLGLLGAGAGGGGDGSHFASDGDTVVLLGDAVPQMDGSEYQRRWFGRTEGIIPDVDLRAEAGLQRVVREAGSTGCVRSVRTCGRGGLAVALAECCLGGLGVRLNLDRIPGAAPAYGGVRTDVALFGEVATRVVASLAPERLGELESLCAAGEVPLIVLGRVGGDSLAFEIRGEQVGVAVTALREAYVPGMTEAGG